MLTSDSSTIIKSPSRHLNFAAPRQNPSARIPTDKLAGAKLGNNAAKAVYNSAAYLALKDRDDDDVSRVAAKSAGRWRILSPEYGMRESLYKTQRAARACMIGKLLRALPQSRSGLKYYKVVDMLSHGCMGRENTRMREEYVIRRDRSTLLVFIFRQFKLLNASVFV